MIQEFEIFPPYPIDKLSIGKNRSLAAPYLGTTDQKKGFALKAFVSLSGECFSIGKRDGLVFNQADTNLLVLRNDNQV